VQSTWERQQTEKQQSRTKTQHKPAPNIESKHFNTKWMATHIHTAKLTQAGPRWEKKKSSRRLALHINCTIFQHLQFLEVYI